MITQRLAHNRITCLGGLAALHGADCRLATLDLRGNALTALSQLAELAGCRRLEQLQLAGRTSSHGLRRGLTELLAAGQSYHRTEPTGNPSGTTLIPSGIIAGNKLCSLAGYRLAIAAALPDLQQLDGALLAPDRQRAGLHLAAAQLSAFQPAVRAVPCSANALFAVLVFLALRPASRDSAIKAFVQGQEANNHICAVCRRTGHLQQKQSWRAARITARRRLQRSCNCCGSMMGTMSDRSVGHQQRRRCRSCL